MWGAEVSIFKHGLKKGLRRVGVTVRENPSAMARVLPLGRRKCGERSSNLSSCKYVVGQLLRAVCLISSFSCRVVILVVSKGSQGDVGKIFES